MNRTPKMPWKEIFGIYAVRLDTKHLDLQYRVPDWRFHAAQQWTRRRPLGVTVADAQFIVACSLVKWLTGNQRHVADNRVSQPPKQLAAAWRAYKIYQQAGLRRAALEARIFARQSAEAIAKAEKLRLSTVIAYERFFCDIRDRLAHTDFISGAIFKIGTPIQPEEVGRILGLFGFHAGPVVLQAMLDDLRSRGLVDYRHLCCPVVDPNRTPGQRRMDLSVLQFLLPQNELVGREFMRMHTRLLREERKDKAEQVQAVNLSQYVQDTAKTAFEASRTRLRVVA